MSHPPNSVQVKTGPTRLFTSRAAEELSKRCHMSLAK